MGLVERLKKFAGCHVGVDLRCHKAFVPQQFLDAANVSPGVEKVGGKTVPQRVWAGPAAESGYGKMLFQEAADTAGRQPSTKAVDEQGLGSIWFLGSAKPVPHVEPAGKGLAGM